MANLLGPALCKSLRQLCCDLVNFLHFTLVNGEHYVLAWTQFMSRVSYHDGPTLMRLISEKVRLSGAQLPELAVTNRPRRQPEATVKGQLLYGKPPTHSLKSDTLMEGECTVSSKIYAAPLRMCDFRI